MCLDTIRRVYKKPSTKIENGWKVVRVKRGRVYPEMTWHGYGRDGYVKEKWYTREPKSMGFHVYLEEPERNFHYHYKVVPVKVKGIFKSGRHNSLRAVLAEQVLFVKPRRKK